VALEDGLRREDVLDLGRADAERERAERAVRGRVRVAADDCRPGQGKTLLGSDNVNNSLALLNQSAQ